MTPLKIGACLRIEEIARHRNWLFDDGRDIEIQNFMKPDILLGDWKTLAEQAKAELAGFEGRIGMHGPFEGLDIDNKDAELRPLITKRFLITVDIAAYLGARQIVLHSPYTLWYQNNIHSWKGYPEAKLARIHEVLGPVVKKAEEEDITLVIENIQDVDPATRRMMVDSFGSDAIALSIDTGHAHLARRMSGAPPVDYFVRDADAQLKHVHLQDVDGHADRHWAPGEGEIEWHAVFRALADAEGDPHLVLELRNKADIPKGFSYLRELGLAK